ncbi:hypothetical protein HMPREF1568_1087 [Providencia alcalifaciens PAL-3]|nr:hypothetical protein HMPREF1568_1087 [Providencia alcalifaciens PAL-3]EUD00031.1 hypothetical protein HMPREF1566_1905 [Providencia alcalifaciens PAL-1]
MIAIIFLSCLYGSEHFFYRWIPVIRFLSCLYGSEPDVGH